MPGTPEHGSNTHDATASPAVSIDELPLPPLDGASLALDDDGLAIEDPFACDAGAAGMLHDVFALDPDQLFIPPGMQQPAGSGAGSLHHSAFDSGSMGEGDPGAELEAGFENEDPTKRTARLARNRESAQLSRQRKKQQLSELERRCRALQSTNSQMHHMVARLSHENHALRHHIAATGGAPLPPHLQMPATPPPLVVLPPGAAMPPGMVPVHPSMMPQTQKVPLPAAAAAGVVAISVPESSGPKPGNLLDDAPSVEKAPVVAAASTATAAAARGGKRRKGAGGSVAAVTAGALAVLSVVCLAGVTVTSTGGVGRAPVGGVDSPAAAQLALGSSSASYGHQMTARRRLMGTTTEPEAETGDMEPIPMRGISREIALRPEPAGVDLWDARGKASYTEVLTGALNEITLNPEASSVQTKNRGVSFENASFDDGEADPLFAAFAAAGLRADALSRVICSEMFRWTPAGNVTAGSGLDVELARRVRVAMEDGESEEDGEEAAVKGTRTIETTNGQTSAGELLPSAIPLPPSVAPDGTSVALNVMGPGDGGAPGGTKRAEAAAARSISSGSFDGEDDAKLVSVLFSEETSEDTGDERLFVVTHSPRSSEYVTYACRFPRGTYIGSTAARSGA